MNKTARAPDPALVDFIAEELARPTIDEAVAFAAALAERPGVSAVLFYGSCLQRGTTEGMLDFYVLADGPAPYGQGPIAAAAGRALPPNVYPETFQGLRAKTAVATPEGFRLRMTLQTLDTTFWARFCQRAALLWARDDAARRGAAEAVAAAVETAAVWAARLAPEAEGAAAWRALFAKTYAVEFRPERRGRSGDIVGAEEARFETLWRLTAPARAAAPAARSLAWPTRWVVGKLLNVARLATSAFTFDGGLRYLVWKIRRHRGRR
ncbi:MAG: hypothetical protein AAGF90_24315 [Pseudomonadota bacterium]